MIIGKEIVQTIADCEQVLKNLQTFVEKTEDQAVKQLYVHLAEQQKQIIAELNERLQYIEQEAPQIDLN